jgi:hypothetical protein
MFADKYYHNQLLKQDYDKTIILPLQLKIKIRYNKSINHLEEYDNILLTVAKELQEKYTGINITYYDSQLIDLIHNLNSDISSVEIQVLDSIGNYIDDGIETTSEKDFLYKLDKLKIQQYTTIFWHWDLDNIEVTMTTREE